MGGLRSKPDLNKSTIQKTGQGFSYVSSSMCGNSIFYLGWRLYMEDAHIATNLSDFFEAWLRTANNYKKSIQRAV